MKILIVSCSDILGGAARAAYRLHNALLEKKINSNMLVMKKKTEDRKVFGPNSIRSKVLSLFYPLIEKKITDIFYKSKKSMFSTGLVPSFEIVNKINFLKPDIVHLHWINGGMLNINDLKKIKAPILWNLQDMWPLTGGCHFSQNCVLYKSKCGTCKVLSSRFKYDLSRLVYYQKLKNYPKIKKLIVNGVSKWIANSAKKSLVFKERKIVNIPNTINTNLFRPINKLVARNTFNLNNNKKIILFAASNINDPRKGFEKLLSALSKIKNLNFILVVAGANYSKKVVKYNFPIHYIPSVSDDISLSFLYNAADLTVVPSLEENLSNTIIESMSCGVSVVAFNIGGNSDIIDHKKNGYLANAKDINDFKTGIIWSLKKNNLINLSARRKIISTFAYSKVVSQYLKLYKNICENTI